MGTFEFCEEHYWDYGARVDNDDLGDGHHPETIGASHGPLCHSHDRGYSLSQGVPCCGFGLFSYCGPSPFCLAYLHFFLFCPDYDYGYDRGPGACAHLQNFRIFLSTTFM